MDSVESNVLLPRGVTDRISSLLEAVPVVVIEGPRASGKTALGALLASRGQLNTRVDLANSTVRRSAESSPNAFVESLERPALIDEAQLVPELALAVKQVVDRTGDPGQFIMTGSSRLGRAQLGGSDPLAGRAVRVRVWPMTQAELAGNPLNAVAQLIEGSVTGTFPALSRSDVMTRITRGGLPLIAGIRSAVPSDLRPSLVSEYVEAVLEHETTGRRDRAELLRTMRYLASTTARILNVSTVASDLGAKRDTVQRRLTELESTFLLHTLPAHRPAEHRVLTAHPKVHAIDTALACWAGRVRGDVPDAATFGGLVETFVVNELVAQTSWNHAPTAVRHWRDTGRKLEVDAVIVRTTGSVAIEVKASTDIRGDDLRGIRAYLAAEPNARGVVFYTGEAVLPLDDQVTAIPISALWERSSRPTPGPSKVESDA